MARNTEFRNAGSKFGSTIRQSLDLITGRNVNNYTLLFLDPTKQHKRGESKNFVVPYIVLGRNASCHVQYGEDYPTVSRQHASIQSDDKGCTLIHNPQATNPTYVDGRPVSGYHNLETGDEIQLSQDGPKIRFIIDRNLKTSTIGFTRRMSMAIGQSLRPYKTALTVAGILLLGLIGYSIWSTVRVSNLESEQAVLTAQIAEADKKVISYMDTLSKLGIKTKDNEDQISSTLQSIERLQKQRSVAARRLGESSISPNSSTASRLLDELEKNIYYVHVLEYKIPGLDMLDETNALMRRWSGTGFLASDGRFYTARHVVQPWVYPESGCDIQALINNYISEGGKVFIKYLAVSPSGDSFMFTGDQIYADQSSDINDEYICDDLDDPEININVPEGRSTDYAYVVLGNKSSNIEYSRSLSSNLERGERLYVHGNRGGYIFRIIIP